MITKICRGNDFRIRARVVTPVYEEDQITSFVDFDLTKCTDVQVQLVCQKDQIIIPVDFSLDGTANNVLLLDIKGAWLHCGMYGLQVTGIDQNNRKWRFKQKSLFLIVENTADVHLNFDLMDNPLDVIVESGIVVTVDTSDFYTKEEIDAKLENIGTRWYGFYDGETYTIDGHTYEELTENATKPIILEMQRSMIGPRGRIIKYTESLYRSQVYRIGTDQTILFEQINYNGEIVVKVLVAKNDNSNIVLEEHTLSNSTIKYIVYDVLGMTPEPDYSDDYFSIVITEEADQYKIEFKNPYRNQYNQLEYSFDKSVWNTMEYDESNGLQFFTTETPKPIYDEETDTTTYQPIWFRGNATNKNNYGIGTFAVYGLYDGEYIQVEHEVAGNCMSLIYADNYLEPDNFSQKDWIWTRLFENDHTLTDASKLYISDKIIPERACQQMFNGCYSLLYGPKLRATVLSDGCYYDMFKNCISLVSIPDLPATDLRSNCYTGMFRIQYDQEMLDYYETDDPSTIHVNIFNYKELPATKLAEGCYSLMFANNIGLRGDKLRGEIVLPATTLADYCYQSMFAGCTQLTVAPELISTDLKPYCYKRMFAGCTNLTKAPHLNASVVSYGAYTEMFKGCTNLSEIYCLATEINGTKNSAAVQIYGCFNWVENVAPTGKFIKETLMTDWTVDKNGIPEGWDIYTQYGLSQREVQTMEDDIDFAINQPLKTINGQVIRGTGNIEISGSGETEHNYENDYLTIVITQESEVAKIQFTSKPLTGGGTPNLFEYSIDDGPWQTMSITDAQQFHAPIYTQAFTNTTNLSTKSYCKIRLRCNATPGYGINGDLRVWNYDAEPQDRIYTNDGLTHNIQGNILSLLFSDNFKGDKYDSLLNYSDSIFADIFIRDTFLLDASNLILKYAHISRCYQNMFYRCTSLVNAPQLPATTLTTSCYNGMFNGCSSLVNAPQLPTTTLAASCYQSMFSGCTSLINAPELPATTLTTGCYNGMFVGCTSLNYVKCLATNTDSGNTRRWLMNVSPTGTFVMANDANWERSFSGIPEGWNAYTEYEYSIVRQGNLDNRLYEYTKQSDTDILAQSTIGHADYVDNTITKYEQHFNGIYAHLNNLDSTINSIKEQLSQLLDGTEVSAHALYDIKSSTINI